MNVFSVLGFSNGMAAQLYNLTLQTPTSGGWNTQLVEHFAVDSTGFASQGPTYDLAGNLTYDGNYAYAYDAWNRLVRVNNAWRETSGFGTTGVTLGPVQTGAVVDVMKYDGLNRRSVKAVQNTGHLDCTYHYYYDNQWRILEERNGSDGVLKQQVWAPLAASGGGGSGYVDELVQVAVNIDLINNPTMNWSPINSAYAPKAYWVMQDANYNVLGLVDATGALKERYEYTPYGQRQVFISAGTNDPDCYVGQYISARVPTGTAGVVQPYGLCEFGHQGLMHDEELGNGELLQNRNRMYHARIGQWMQREPLGYVDGMSLYQYVRSRVTFGRDPTGYAMIYPGDPGNPVFPTGPNVNWGGGARAQNGQVGLGIRITGIECCHSVNFVVYFTYRSRGWGPNITTPRLDDGTWGLRSNVTPNPPYFNSTNTIVVDGTATLNIADGPMSGEGGTYHYTAYVVCNDNGPNHGRVYGAWQYTITSYLGWGPAFLDPTYPPQGPANPILPHPLPLPPYDGPPITPPVTSRSGSYGASHLFVGMY